MRAQGLYARGSDSSFTSTAPSASRRRLRRLLVADHAGHVAAMSRRPLRQRQLHRELAAILAPAGQLDRPTRPSGGAGGRAGAEARLVDPAVPPRQETDERAPDDLAG